MEATKNKDLKPIIHSGSVISWYCECGYAMRARTYPIDLTKDSIEIYCDNVECKWHNKVVGVKMERLEVFYVKG